MKRILIIIIGALFCLLQAYGQNDYCQKIVNMVMADSCFQAIEYMEKHRDAILSSEETMALYKFKMFGFMNQPDSSIYYLEKILKDYPSIYGGKDSLSETFFINMLLDLYYKNGDYSKSLELYNSIEKSLQSSSLSGNEWIDMQLTAIKRAKQSFLSYSKNPKIQIANVSNNEATLIPLTKQKPLIAIPIKCNGINLQTWVDTGWSSHLFMTKKTARKCGLQIAPIEVGRDSIKVNGKQVGGGVSVVDSLYIGDLLITDVPVFITDNEYASFLPDSLVSDKKYKAKYDSIFGFSDVILGLPLLKMFGSVEFDWDKEEMRIELKPKILPSKEKPNMFLAHDVLYGHLSMNGNSFVGLLDTGASRGGIRVSPSFYRLHKNNVDSLSVEREMPHFGIGIYYLLYKDGLIGLPFFKKIGKRVKFDFVNMRLTAE